MDINTQMKLDAISYAARSKTLRKLELQCKKKARRNTTVNFPVWNIRREEYYTSRLDIREVSRYLGLARAFLKERPYLSVENQVREGNEVDVPYLAIILENYGVYVPEHFIAMWVAA